MHYRVSPPNTGTQVPVAPPGIRYARARTCFTHTNLQLQVRHHTYVTHESSTSSHVRHTRIFNFNTRTSTSTHELQLQHTNFNFNIRHHTRTHTCIRQHITARTHYLLLTPSPPHYLSFFIKQHIVCLHTGHEPFIMCLP